MLFSFIPLCDNSTKVGYYIITGKTYAENTYISKIYEKDKKLISPINHKKTLNVFITTSLCEIILNHGTIKSTSP